jgi:WD40 repeat protein
MPGSLAPTNLDKHQTDSLITLAHNNLWNGSQRRALDDPCVRPWRARFWRYVLTGSLDQTAQLWDVATGKPLGKPMTHEGGVVVARFSPD